MKAVIYSNKPLPALARMAADTFGRVPNRQVSRPEITVPVVTDAQKGIIIHYVPALPRKVRGAKSIVEHGHLDDVDYVLGAHMGGGPEQKEAAIGIGDGESLATVKYDVEFYGKGSHAAASPEEGKNAMLAMATAILNLHAIPGAVREIPG